MDIDISTAGDITRSEQDAVLVKISRQLKTKNIEEAIRKFLQDNVSIRVESIINWHTEIQAPDITERFSAQENFRLKKDGGIFSIINKNFFEWFLDGEGKVEDPERRDSFRCGNLSKKYTDTQILEDLGEKKQEHSSLMFLPLLLSRQKGSSGHYY